jgi:hypothetical protein
MVVPKFTTPKQLKECPFHLGKRLSTTVVTTRTPSLFSKNASGVAKEDEVDDYEGGEFTEGDEGEFVNCIVQRVFVNP